MCGIFCAISCSENALCELDADLEQLLHNRGPDVQDTLQIDQVLLSGNVLWQQGAEPQKQPIVADNLVLLFNGDLYGLDGKKPAQQSDSAWLMEQLLQCDDQHEDAKLLALLQQLQGPYCLVLYNRLPNPNYIYIYVLHISLPQTHSMCLLLPRCAGQKFAACRAADAVHPPAEHSVPRAALGVP